MRRTLLLRLASLPDLRSRGENQSARDSGSNLFPLSRRAWPKETKGACERFIRLGERLFAAAASTRVFVCVLHVAEHILCSPERTTRIDLWDVIIL